MDGLLGDGVGREGVGGGGGLVRWLGAVQCRWGGAVAGGNGFETAEVTGAC